MMRLTISWRSCRLGRRYWVWTLRLGCLVPLRFLPLVWCLVLAVRGLSWVGRLRRRRRSASRLSVPLLGLCRRSLTFRARLARSRSFVEGLNLMSNAPDRRRRYVTLLVRLTTLL